MQSGSDVNPGSGHDAADLARDELTGFLTRPNLSVFAHRLQAKDPTACWSMLAVELSRFGVVNVSVGVQTGDRIIATLAKRLGRLFAHAPAIARLHGDHFGIILPESDDLTAQIDRLIDFAERPLAVDGEVIVLSVRIGVACRSEALSDPDQVLQAAEAALHRSKAAMAKVSYYDNTMLDEARNLQKLENDLRVSLVTNSLELHGALANAEFSLVYQPIIDTTLGRIHGFEALLRWNHPKRGQVSPAEFIPLAEQIHVMSVLGTWVIRQALSDAATWRANGDGSYPIVSINLSGAQFDEADVLLRGASQAIAHSGVPTERINFEITESAQFSPVIAPRLKAFTEMGCSLALDDFGTGYSSISRLVGLPLTYVKIDRSLVADLTAIDPPQALRARRMVRAVLALADSLDLTPIIEGIETPTGISAIRALGGSFIQGFVFAKPMPPEQVNSYIATFKAGEVG